MRYTRHSTRNLVSLTILVVVMFIAVLAVGCGGGSSTPTGPKPTPTPPPVVQPSISLSAATPDCGATIPSGGSVDVRVYVVASTGSYAVQILLLDASGANLGGTAISPTIPGTGFYDIMLKLRTPATTTSMVLNLQEALGGPAVLATQTSQCGFTWQ